VTTEAEMATLTIPAKYAPMMRIAALREIEDEARGLKDQAAKAVEAIHKNEWLAMYQVEKAKDLEWLMSDFLGNARSVGKFAPVAIQICEGREEIAGDAEALAYMLDSMWRRVVSARLSELDGPLFMDDEEREFGVGFYAEALTWAKTEADRLNAVWRAERAQKDEEA